MRLVEEMETRRLLASFTASSVAELVADINAANAAGGSNSITLKAGASFKLVGTDSQTGTALQVVAGNELTVFGNGDTIERSTAAGTPAFRLFGVAAGASLALNNLTLSGGLALGPTTPLGGGIVSGGTLSLNGVTVQNCTAQAQVQGFSAGTAQGGGIYSSGALAVANSTIRNNQALGSDGNQLPFVPHPSGGAAAGGGLFLAGGTASLTNTTLSSNLARGGNGASSSKSKGSEGGFTNSGGDGGDATGGAIHAAGGTVELRGTTFTKNAAKGGIGGNSPQGLPKGPDGAGRGGGVYIAASALVGLDSFTQAHTSGNTASTSGNDIFGSFTILA